MPDVTLDQFKKKFNRPTKEVQAVDAQGSDSIITLDTFRENFSRPESVGGQKAATALPPSTGSTPINNNSNPPDTGKEVSTDTPTPIPVSEEGVGDAWQRGFATAINASGDALNLFHGMGKDIAEATGLPPGTIIRDIKDWLYAKGEDLFNSAEPSTLKPAENFLDYLDPERVYQVVAEGLPLMGSLIATTYANPTVGGAILFGIEGGSTRKSIDEYEQRTGKKVDPFLKNFASISVGAANAALEKLGINTILGKGLSSKIKGKLFNLGLSTIVEGGTEGAQEINQILGKYIATGELDKNIGDRFVKALYSGLVLGVVGGGVTSGTKALVDRSEAKQDKRVEDIYSELSDIPSNEPTEQNIIQEFKRSNIVKTTFGTDASFVLTKSTKKGENYQVSVFESDTPKGDQGFETLEDAVAFMATVRGASVREAHGNVKPTRTPEGGLKFSTVPLDKIEIKGKKTIGKLESTEDGIKFGYLGMDSKDVHRFEAIFARLSKQSRLETKEILASDLSDSEKAKAINEWNNKWGSKIQILREALEAKKQKSIKYDFETDKIIETPYSSVSLERDIKIIKKMSKSEIRTWVNKKTQQSPTLNSIKGEGPPTIDDQRQHKYGAKLYDKIFGGEELPPETTEEEYAATYIKPRTLGMWSKHLFGTVFGLRNHSIAQEDAYALIVGEMKLNHANKEHELQLKSNFKAVRKNKKAMEQVNNLIALAQELRKNPDSIETQQKIDNLLVKYPELSSVLDGYKGEGGAYDMFRKVLKRYQTYIREGIRPGYSAEENGILDAIINISKEKGADTFSDKKTKKETFKIVKDLVRNNVDVDGILSNTKKDYSKLSDSKQKRARESYIRRRAKKLINQGLEIIDIDTWTVEDYLFGIESGSYNIVDPDNPGVILGSAATKKEARKKAFRIRKELGADGDRTSSKHLEVVSNFTTLFDKNGKRVKRTYNPINPTTNVLKETNFFEAFPIFVHAMEKRMIFDPIIKKYQESVKTFPEEYTDDVKFVIQKQIEAIKGSVYSLGDEFVDKISVGFGWKTGKYSRTIGRARKITAIVKLGYRPTAAVINAGGGFGNTWVGVGTEYFKAGSKAWRSGKYVDPDGVEIDMEATLKEVNELLGIDFAISESGVVKPRVSLWHPLGLFQFPETKIRPHGFVSNYVMQREAFGLDHEEAKEAALHNLWFQNFTYNLTSLPHILRSPGGKLFGQFKSYMIFQTQFMSTLRGAQIPRMIAVQLALAGPRGFVYLLRSIYILGAMGFLDNWEEWLVKDTSLIANALSRGIGGLVGGDVSAAATFQVPNEEKDWLGPTLSEAVDFTTKVAIPAIQNAERAVSGKETKAYISDEGIDWVTGLSPLSTYYRDLYNSVIHQDFGDNGEEVDLLTRLQKPNIWVRDSQGNKAWKVGGLQDRALLALGVAPVSKSQYQVLKGIWIKDTKIQRENRTKWYNKVTKALINGQEISKDLWADAYLYKIDPAQIPKAIVYKEMTPQQRETMKARIFDKLEAFDHFALDRIEE